MLRRIGLTRIAATVLIVSIAVPALTVSAHAYPAGVIAKCRGDYKRLCPQYKKIGNELEACMRANYRSISNICMNSLVDAGIAPAFARRR